MTDVDFFNFLLKITREGLIQWKKSPKTYFDTELGIKKEVKGEEYIECCLNIVLTRNSYTIDDFHYDCKDTDKVKNVIESIFDYVTSKEALFFNKYTKLMSIINKKNAYERN